MSKRVFATKRGWLPGVLSLAIAFTGAGVSRAGSMPGASAEQMTAKTAPASTQAAILKPEVMADLMPAQVFFRGQSATVQMRNSSGVRYADGMLTLAALVDTSGYSSGIQQRYQAYLITEVPLELGDRTLPAGAYGVGFIQNDRFIVMDLGAHELLNIASQRDAALHRAMPLQIVDAPAGGAYRLYVGRSFVVMHRAQ